MTTPDADTFPVARGRVALPHEAGAKVGVHDAAREPAWVRLAPVALAVMAGVLYLWNLDVSGYANTYYSAAAQAASQSLSAWFYGALDGASFITVDKPPAALWAMGLSVRLLGLSPVAVLLPEALAGVASVVLLYLTVKRQLGPVAALIAGAAFAVTPVAVLMFRYNNPDAILTLLLVAAAWALVRGLEHGRIRWAVLAAVFIGVAFLTKYLQAYLVLPAFALTWVVAAPGSVRRRIGGLAVSLVAVAVSSLWWVGIVEMVPAASRPYIGGSPTNSAVQLLLGYDGLGRIFGSAGGGNTGGGPGGGAAFGGDPGLLRMFNTEWGGEVSWLLPGAALGLVVGLVARFRAPRTDHRRAAFLLWGTWAAVHVLVFSLMSGIAHPYYAVALAPAAAALFGGGIGELWRARRRVRWSGLVLGAMLVVTAAWARVLLERTPGFVPGAGLGALVVAAAAAILVAVTCLLRRSAGLARVALAVGVAAVLVGPVLYAGATMSKAIAGGDPAAGPNDGRFGVTAFPGALGGGPAGVADTTSAAVVEYLVQHRGDATWLVAVTSANQAAPIQLQTGVPVMAMGGFMGTDPAPTRTQVQALVRDGKLRYVLLGGFGFGVGGRFDVGAGRAPSGGTTDGQPTFGAPAGAGGGLGTRGDAGADGGFGAPGAFAPGGFGGAVAAALEVARDRTDWVTSACTPVSIDGQEAGLYDCAGAAG